MGSGTSRRKKIASQPSPTVGGDEDGCKRDEDRTVVNNSLDQTQEFGYRSYKIPKVIDYTHRTRGGRAWLSEEENESDFSIEDDEDIEAELDRVLDRYDDYEFHPGRKYPKNSFTRSNTYSFCDARQVYKGPSFSSTPYIHQGLDSRVDRLASEVSGNVQVLSKELNKQKELNPPVSAWGKHPPENCKHSTEFCGQQNSGSKVTGCFDPRKFKEANRNKALLSKSKQDTENNNLPNQCQSGSEILPTVQAPVLYDYSEEELMASIEQEYC